MVKKKLSKGESAKLELELLKLKTKLEKAEHQFTRWKMGGDSAVITSTIWIMTSVILMNIGNFILGFIAFVMGVFIFFFYMRANDKLYGSKTW